MNILELQARVLQMKLGGLTKIQIADRLEISDEVLDNILHSIGSNRGSVKKYIRKQVMNMSLSELDKLKINDINLSSVIARLEYLYCGFDNIPESSIAYRNTQKYTKVDKNRARKPLPHKRWDIEKAQQMLDQGISKADICREVGISLPLLSNQITYGALDATEWNNYKYDRSGYYALLIEDVIVAKGSILDISNEMGITRELLRMNINEFFSLSENGEILFLKKLSYYERGKLEMV
ncbi:hypothetical protein [Companilactobacillus sp. HBUAS59699]|uniref:hypothetical protein n=1 Tax=Companilactobacillus sp. HBUAS59699 TaxID=3109358 RepID=UPI002FEF9248